MLSWMRKSAGKRWVKVMMVVLAATFFAGFGLLGSTKVKNCLGVEDQNAPVPLVIIDKDPSLVVSENEFRNRVSQREQQIRNMYRNNFPGQSIPDGVLNVNRIHREVIDQMVRELLVEKEAEKLGLKASKSEIQNEIAGILARNGLQFDGRAYRDFLSRVRMTDQDFEGMIAQNIVMEKVQGIVASGVTVTDEEARERYAFENGKVKLDCIVIDPAVIAADALPSDTAVKEYYDDKTQDFELGETRRVEYVSWSVKDIMDEIQVSGDQVEEYYEGSKERYMIKPPLARARHIIIQVDKMAPENDVEAARIRIEEIKKKADEPGADFAELAKQFSEGPTKDNGGDLGWFTKGDYSGRFKDEEGNSYSAMVSEFEEASFSLEPGQISEPFRSDFGFHIVKLEEKKDPQYMGLDLVKDEVAESVKHTLALSALNERAQSFMAMVKDPSLAEPVPGDSADAADGDTAAKEEAPPSGDDDPFLKAASLQGKEVKTSNWFQAFDDGIFGLADSKAIIEPAFKLEEGQVSEPISGVDHVYIVRAIDFKSERQGSLEEVRDRIVKILKPPVEVEKTMETASGYVQALKKGELEKSALLEKDGVELVEVDFTPRAELFIEGVGYSDTLMKEVGLMSESSPWPEDPVEVGGKVVIAHLLATEPADMSEFAEREEAFKSQMLMMKRKETIESWLDNMAKGGVEYTDKLREISKAF